MSAVVSTTGDLTVANLLFTLLLQWRVTTGGKYVIHEYWARNMICEEFSQNQQHVSLW